MSRSSVSGHFIPGAKGSIFVLLRQPTTPARGCVLVVPPFAEEMNKCRRMVTEVAMGLAERGTATLVPDLSGTGDSSGDFSDGNWETWQDDVARTARWSADRGMPVTAILAIRLGGALAAAALASGRLGSVARAVLWQPVFDGGRFLAQFLRLRVAASLMDDRKETLAELKTLLATGESVEVAGYRLSPRLAAALESLPTPDRLHAGFGEVAWLEIAREEGAELPPPTQRLIDASRAAGAAVHTAGWTGEPFWSSAEIVVNRPLVDSTVERLSAHD